MTAGSPIVGPVDTELAAELAWSPAPARTLARAAALRDLTGCTAGAALVLVLEHTAGDCACGSAA